MDTLLVATTVVLSLAVALAGASLVLNGMLRLIGRLPWASAPVRPSPGKPS
jgi:hypothetical protein